MTDDFRCPKHPKEELQVMAFHSLSKSGKTIYFYAYCRKCKPIYRYGFRVKELETVRRELHE